MHHNASRELRQASILLFSFEPWLLSEFAFDAANLALTRKSRRRKGKSEQKGRRWGLARRSRSPIGGLRVTVNGEAGERGRRAINWGPSLPPPTLFVLFGRSDAIV